MQETEKKAGMRIMSENVLNLPDTKALKEAALVAAMAAIQVVGLFAVKALGRKIGLRLP